MTKRTHTSFMSCFYLILSLLILSSCQSEDTNEHSFTLMGESENWNLNSYEINFTKDQFQIGNGTLTMKKYSEYQSNSFSFRTHVVTAEGDDRIHGGSVGGDKIDISEQTTGTIEGDKILSLEEIHEIYMIVGWWDKDKNEMREERLDLYTRDS